jgi:hypothetical protein
MTLLVGYYAILVTVVDAFARLSGVPKLVYAGLGAVTAVYLVARSIREQAKIDQALGTLDSLCDRLASEGHDAAVVVYYVRNLLQKVR